MHALRRIWGRWRAAGGRDAPPSRPALPPDFPLVSGPLQEGVAADWGRYLRLLLAVRPAGRVEPPLAGERILFALAKVLASPAACERLLRRAPGLVPRLLQALRDPNYSRPAVVRLVSHDKLLAAELVRVTRSALYAHRGSDKASVGHGVDLLGRIGMQQVVARALLRPLLSHGDGGLQLRAAPTIWDDTERCALLAATLAPRFGLDAGDAYLAALLHGMAWSAVLRALELHAAAPLLHAGLFEDSAFVASLRAAKSELTQSLAVSWGVAWAVGRDDAGRQRWDSLVGVVEEMVCVQRLHAQGDLPSQPACMGGRRGRDRAGDRRTLTALEAVEMQWVDGRRWRRAAAMPDGQRPQCPCQRYSAMASLGLARSRAASWMAVDASNWACLVSVASWLACLVTETTDARAANTVMATSTLVRIWMVWGYDIAASSSGFFVWCGLEVTSAHIHSQSVTDARSRGRDRRCQRDHPRDMRASAGHGRFEVRKKSREPRCGRLELRVPPDRKRWPAGLVRKKEWLTSLTPGTGSTVRAAWFPT